MSLPNAISLKEGSFSGCQNLEKIDFPNCQNISNYTFPGCPIEDMKLQSCTFLGEKSFGDENKFIKILSLPELTNLNDRKDFADVPNIIDLYLPKLKIVKKMNFSALINLKYLNLDGVETMERKMLNLPNLENVSMKSLTDISGETFFNAYNLKYVYIPNVKSIGANAYVSCSNLEELNL